MKEVTGTPGRESHIFKNHLEVQRGVGRECL